MTSPALAEAIEANRFRRCANPQCNALRRRLDKTCLACRRRYLAYGSPNAKPIPPRNWKTYRDQVQRMLALNERHPALLAAEQFVADWLELARHADEPNEAGYFLNRGPGYREAQRLTRHGVSARLILATVAAVFMLLQWDPMQSVDEERCAYSRAIFGLAPRDRRKSIASGGKTSYPVRVKRKALMEVGEMVMEHLSFFMVLARAGVQDMVEGAAKREEDRKAALRAPFAVSA